MNRKINNSIKSLNISRDYFRETITEFKERFEDIEKDIKDIKRAINFKSMDYIKYALDPYPNICDRVEYLEYLIERLSLLEDYLQIEHRSSESKTIPEHYVKKVKTKKGDK